MKTMISFILGIFVIASFADNLPVDRYVIGGSPTNTLSYNLTDESIDTVLGRDSIAIGGQNIYGPISLRGTGKEMATYAALYAKPLVVASGDTVEVDYQITAEAGIKDTVATWIVWDTLFSTGNKGATDIALSAKVGNYLWVKVKNVDATAAELAKRILVMLK